MHQNDWLTDWGGAIQQASRYFKTLYETQSRGFLTNCEKNRKLTLKIKSTMCNHNFKKTDCLLEKKKSFIKSASRL